MGGGKDRLPRLALGRCSGAILSVSTSCTVRQACCQSPKPLLSLCCSLGSEIFTSYCYEVLEIHKLGSPIEREAHTQCINT